MDIVQLRVFFLFEFNIRKLKMTINHIIEFYLFVMCAMFRHFLINHMTDKNENLISQSQFNVRTFYDGNILMVFYLISHSNEIFFGNFAMHIALGAYCGRN